MRAPLVAFGVLAAACGADAGGASRPAATPSTQPGPVLIQVENIAAARPQSGLGVADVVYEYVTEGGISRFSVLYLHPPQSRIGPVRSARLVTIDLARHYGALLLYSGASAYVQHQIEQSGVRNFNETTAHGDLFRVNGRIAPHNLYTDGSRITALLNQAALPPVTWRLWARTRTPTAQGTLASSFQVPISYAETPIWTFDAATARYLRREPDTGAFTDAASGQPVTAATVVVQQVTISEAPEVEDVSGAHGVEQNVDIGGAAQVFSDGREYDATWAQPATGPPTFTLVSGSPAPIAPGPVWIELVPVGSRAHGV